MSAEVRCDEHVGLPYPPRCAACDAAAVEAEWVPVKRVGPVDVPLDGWPVPADEPDEWSSDE